MEDRNRYERNIINEALIRGNKMIPLFPILKATKSICQVHTPSTFGSGFLINLSANVKPFYCLMTNEHIINKSMIKNKVTIKIFFDNEEKSRKIELNERTVKEFTYMGIDATVVEILPKYKIGGEYFLMPDDYYMDYYNELKYLHNTGDHGNRRSL